MRKDVSPSTYAELIEGIRQGNSSAVTNFRNIFTPGIQFFIGPKSGASNVLDRVEEVIMSVIEEIKKGNITSPNLPSQILESIHRSIGVRKPSRPSAQYDAKEQSVADVAQIATDLLKVIPEREFKALKRYYVDLEDEDDICAEVDLTIDQFRNFKRGFRARLMTAKRVTK